MKKELVERHHYKFEFQSMGEFIKYLRDNDSAPKKYSDEYEQVYTNSRRAWYGSRNLEDAIEICENGWTEKAKRLTTKIKTYTTTSDFAKYQKRFISQSGFQPIVPLYLAGPAGSGKNFTVEQIAWELGWNFYFSNSVQQEYKLDGFIDAGGKYHETEFYKACTDDHDCIFFLDEMDASIPEVLINLNAAIANGYYNFPTGRVNLDHVHFVAAGNTVGSGADEMYSGRMVLDQATLDRFAIIDFDYSRRIEMSISNNNSELVDFIHSLRKEAEENGIRATFSYRCITMVTKLEAAGMDLTEIIKFTVVKGMDKDTIKTLNPNGYTKYHQALRKVKAA